MFSYYVFPLTTELIHFSYIIFVIFTSTYDIYKTIASYKIVDLSLLKPEEVRPKSRTFSCHCKLTEDKKQIVDSICKEFPGYVYIWLLFARVVITFFFCFVLFLFFFFVFLRFWPRLMVQYYVLGSNAPGPYLDH